MFGSGRRGWIVGEWMRALSLGFANPVGIGGVLNVCLCLGCCGVWSAGREWVGGLDWRGGGGVIYV